MISILIPVYNSEKFISDTLDSILKQQYEEWECIIVDDGSTDNTLNLCIEYSKKDSRFKVFVRNRLPKNASTCRNIAFEKSSGDYIIFLDSDDLLEDFCLSHRVSFMNSNDTLDFSVFQMRMQGSDKLMVKEKRNYLIAFISFDLPWAITCPIWKRSFFARLNGFNELYQRVQDPELHLRALALHPKFQVLCNSAPDCIYRFTYKDNLVINKKKIYGLRLFILTSLGFLEQEDLFVKKNILKTLNVLIKAHNNRVTKMEQLWLLYIVKALNKSGVISSSRMSLLFIFISSLKRDNTLSNKLICLFLNMMLDLRDGFQRVTKKLKSNIEGL